jgi:hypothetical protein
MTEEQEKVLYGCITVAQEFQGAAEKAVKSLPDAARDAIRDAVREYLVRPAENATKGLLDASNEVKGSSAILRRTRLSSWALCTGRFYLVFGAVYALGGWIFKSRADELAELKTAIQAEEATLAKLREKTWRLELMNFGDGTRGVVLPKGVKFDHTGSMQDGRTAIVITP